MEFSWQVGRDGDLLSALPRIESNRRIRIANTHELIVGMHRRYFPKKVGCYSYRKLKSPKMLKMPLQ